MAVPGGHEGDYDALYRSYISLLKDVDHLSTLREIALSVNTSIELDEVLPTIATVVQGALEVRKITLYLLEESGSVARPVVARFGRDLIAKDRIEEETVHVKGAPLGDALSTRMPIVLNTSYQSAAYVPLLANGVAVGVLRLEDRLDGQPFSQEEAGLFQTVGSMIAIAINNAQLYAMAVTDGLTGLYVRRYFDLRMAEEFEQAKRYGREFSLLMFDIDHFKKFNDTHGHQTGDAVLRRFARILKDNTRASDICCRYGGEEMAIILPENTCGDARALAEKLRETVEAFPFEGAGGQSLHVTTSIGVAAFGESFEAADQLVEAADGALYAAKHAGRNRVELAA